MALSVHDDTDLLLGAMAYIGAVHRAVAPNALPAPGVGECVLEAILADPALSDYVRKWARSTKVNATDWTPEEPPSRASAARRGSPRTAAIAEAAGLIRPSLSRNALNVEFFRAGSGRSVRAPTGHAYFDDRGQNECRGGNARLR